MTLDRAAALSLLPSPWCWLALVPGAVAVGCVGWIERLNRRR